MTARVLIVEDEIFVATDMAETLSDYGYDCVGIADDTASAMRLGRGEVDIALVDVNLCDGATGPAIGAALANSGVKVIFVTANPRQLGNGIPGTVGVLTKPCNFALVGEAIAFALGDRDESRTPTPPPGLELFAAA